MYSIVNTFLSAGFGADVDSFVVDTNYDEYAMMLLLSTEKPSGNKTTTVKLYSEWWFLNLSMLSCCMCCFSLNVCISLCNVNSVFFCLLQVELWMWGLLCWTTLKHWSDNMVWVMTPSSWIRAKVQTQTHTHSSKSQKWWLHSAFLVFFWHTEINVVFVRNRTPLSILPYPRWAGDKARHSSASGTCFTPWCAEMIFCILKPQTCLFSHQLWVPCVSIIRIFCSQEVCGETCGSCTKGGCW